MPETEFGTGSMKYLPVFKYLDKMKPYAHLGNISLSRKYNAKQFYPDAEISRQETFLFQINNLKKRILQK